MGNYGRWTMDDEQKRGCSSKFIVHSSWFIVVGWPDEEGIATIFSNPLSDHKRNVRNLDLVKKGLGPNAGEMIVNPT